MFWYPPAWVWLGICIVGRVVVLGGVILWLVFLPDRLQAGIFPPGSLLFLFALLVDFSRTLGETDAVFSDRDLLWIGSIGRRNLPAMSSPTESKWAGPKNRWRPQEFYYLPMPRPGPPGEIGKRSVNRKWGKADLYPDFRLGAGRGISLTNRIDDFRQELIHLLRRPADEVASGEDRVDVDIRQNLI